MRYKHINGDVHKVDTADNHFINGKCVNPKSSDEAPIGQSFYDIDPQQLRELPVVEEIVVTGHVPEFEYYDHDQKKFVQVKTGRDAT